jgi:hypothetical protein
MAPGPSPVYPGHESLYDCPQGSCVELHAPGFVGTNVQRLAYPWTPATSKTWYETDTGLTYQWTGSSWIPFGASVANTISLAVANVVLAGAELGISGIPVSGTISGGICTITHVNHGYKAGDIIVLAGTTTISGTFARLYIITSVTYSTYSFFCSATGTLNSPVEWFWFSGPISLNPTKISNIIRQAAGVYQFFFAKTQPGFYYGVNSTGVSLAATLYTGTMGTNLWNQTGFQLTYSNLSTGIDATTSLFVAITGAY